MIENINVKKIAAVVAAGSVLVVGGLLFSKYTKTSDCEVKDFHLHKYQNGEMIRYIADENLYKNGYTWTDEIKYVDENDIDLYDFEAKNKLIKIDDNIDYLTEQMENNNDFMQYEYKYIHLQPIPHVVNGVTTFTYIPFTRYGWTADINHSNLTGEKRLCRYLYRGYKIEKDENGKYTLIESPDTDNLIEIKDEYPYIKENYYRIVNSNNYQEIDFEEETDEQDYRNDEAKKLSKNL